MKLLLIYSQYLAFSIVKCSKNCKKKKKIKIIDQENSYKDRTKDQRKIGPIGIVTIHINFDKNYKNPKS